MPNQSRVVLEGATQMLLAATRETGEAAGKMRQSPAVKNMLRAEAVTAQGGQCHRSRVAAQAANHSSVSAGIPPPLCRRQNTRERKNNQHKPQRATTEPSAYEGLREKRKVRHIAVKRERGWRREGRRRTRSRRPAEGGQSAPALSPRAHAPPATAKPYASLSRPAAHGINRIAGGKK